VLLAADGVPNRRIAPMIGMHEHTVAHWRRRFQAERLVGLQERKRSGRPWFTATTSGCGSWPR
jgi:transposase